MTPDSNCMGHLGRHIYQIKFVSVAFIIYNSWSSGYIEFHPSLHVNVANTATLCTHPRHVFNIYTYALWINGTAVIVHNALMLEVAKYFDLILYCQRLLKLQNAKIIATMNSKNSMNNRAKNYTSVKSLSCLQTRSHS